MLPIRRLLVELVPGGASTHFRHKPHEIQREVSRLRNYLGMVIEEYKAMQYIRVQTIVDRVRDNQIS